MSSAADGCTTKHNLDTRSTLATKCQPWHYTAAVLGRLYFE